MRRQRVLLALAAIIVSLHVEGTEAWWGKKGQQDKDLAPLTEASPNSGEDELPNMDKNVDVSNAIKALNAAELDMTKMPEIEYDAYAEGKVVKKVVDKVSNKAKEVFTVPDAVLEKGERLKHSPKVEIGDLLKYLHDIRHQKVMLAMNAGGPDKETDIATGLKPRAARPVSDKANQKKNPETSKQKNHDLFLPLDGIHGVPVEFNKGQDIIRDADKLEPRVSHSTIALETAASVGSSCHLGPNEHVFSQLEIAVKLSQQTYRIGDGIKTSCTNCPVTIASKTFTIRKVFTPGYRLGWLGNYRGPYFIATHGDTIYLAFRGTWSAADGISDASTDMAPYNFGGSSYGYTHAGFTALWSRYPLQSHIDAIRKAVPAVRDNPKFVLCGHSLGGGVGQLAALEVALAYGTVPNLYTFGSPRAGNADFRRAFRKHVYHTRVRYDRDVVTSLPQLGYRVAIRSTHGLPLMPKVPNWYYHNADSSIRLMVVGGKNKYRCVDENNSVAGYRLRDHSLDNKYTPAVVNIHAAFKAGAGSSRSY